MRLCSPPFARKITGVSSRSRVLGPGSIRLMEGKPKTSMETRLHLEILPQPDDTTCGPTCLQAIYTFFNDDISLEDVVAGVKRLEHGGTLAARAVVPGYPDPCDEIHAAMERILAEGPLARRILRAIGGDFSRNSLKGVYRELYGCLSAGRLFPGRD